MYCCVLCVVDMYLVCYSRNKVHIPIYLQHIQFYTCISRFFGLLSHILLNTRAVNPF